MSPAKRSERSPRFRPHPHRSRRSISLAAVGGVLVVGAMPAPALFNTATVGSGVASVIGEGSGTSTSTEVTAVADLVPGAASTGAGSPTEPTGPTEPGGFELAVSSVEIQGTFADEIDLPEDGAGAAEEEADEPEPEVEEQPLPYVGADGALIDAERLRVWLIDRDSPLAAHAEELVTAGVEHDVDPRLVVGIAAIESSVGLRLPPGTHNAWGWSGNGPHGMKAWSSWPEAIHDFTERLARIYDTDNVDERFAQKYVPPNWEKWLYTVRWVMEDI